MYNKFERKTISDSKSRPTSPSITSAMPYRHYKDEQIIFSRETHMYADKLKLIKKVKQSLIRDRKLCFTLPTRQRNKHLLTVNQNRLIFVPSFSILIASFFFKFYVRYCNNDQLLNEAIIDAMHIVVGMILFKPEPQVQHIFKEKLREL